MTRRLQFLLCVLVLFGALIPVKGVKSETRRYEIGDRLLARTMPATSGPAQMLRFENPTIVILWATWSPASLVALKELVTGAPKGGVRWLIIPINVDAPSLAPSDTARVNEAAREAGWAGPVWHDRGYQFMDELGVFSIPTVIFTGLGGAIDEVEHNWTPVLRDRLFALYFGAITDSFPGVPMPTASAPCRNKAAMARSQWRSGEKSRAVALMRSVVDSCPGLPNDYGRYADWVWSTGDSLRERDEVERIALYPGPTASTRCVAAGLAGRQGDCAKAQALSREAVAIDSAFYPAWILLAETSRQCGDSSSAVHAYQRARLLNRLDSRVLALGAIMAEERGDLAESVRLLQAAVEARMRRIKR